MDECLNIIVIVFIIVIWEQMSVWSSIISNPCSKLNTIRVIFTDLKLWVATAIHNFKWVKIMGRVSDIVFKKTGFHHSISRVWMTGRKH